MKKLGIALLSAFLLAGLTGCAKPTAELPPEASVQIPNPVVEVDGADAFAALGLSLDAPDSAQQVCYSIISNELAQVQFALDGRSYTYRGAKTKEDISGVYETFDDSSLALEADGDGFCASITVKTIQKGAGGGLATWSYDDAQYSLFTPDSITGEELGEFAVSLAEKLFSHSETAQ